MGTIQTLQEASRDWVREHAEAVGPMFLESVRPIYGVNERSTPSPVPIDSCILLKVGDDLYLVTAAHVIDDAKVTELFQTARSAHSRSTVGTECRGFCRHSNNWGDSVCREGSQFWALHPSPTLRVIYGFPTAYFR